MRKRNLVLCFLMVSIIGVSMFGKTTAYPNNQQYDEIYVIVSADFEEEVFKVDYNDDEVEILPHNEILEIVNATYLDIDGDGSEDDIMTDFIFRVPTGNLAYMICDIYIELEYPSQNVIYSNFRLTGTYVEVSIYLDWINAAIEGGDYIFTVQIDCYGIDEEGYYIYGSISNSIVFDPPCAGPVGGLPT